MFVASLVPRLSRRLVSERRPSAVNSDLEALLVRIRQRLYHESLPVLASYWLKTIWWKGHNRAWWTELDERFEQVLSEQTPATPSREVIVQIHTWIRQTVLGNGKTSAIPPPQLEPFRTDVTAEGLAPYTVRLLNEWLPAEVSRLLIDEVESALQQDDGIPVLMVARALERLLVRERLLPGTLQRLLQPELVSPQYVYPAHMEILRDVLLALLGRTWAPAPPVMPATIVGSAAEVLDTAEYSDAIRRARYLPLQRQEEIHVPIGKALAFEILKGDPVRIGSIIVTMDGRWWESEKLQSGEEYEVVYRPVGRLRVDCSADQAKLRVPWPETQLRWSGDVRFREFFEIFGRQWHVSRWETDGDRTWLTLTFSRALRMPESLAASVGFRRSHPAFVDMAWAALESALAASVLQNSCEPIEQMRRSDLIPLGHAIYRLANAMKGRQHGKRETVEIQLGAVRYLQAEVSLQYGRVPWKILPAAIRDGFRKSRLDARLVELFDQAFDEIPPELIQPMLRESHADQKTELPSPPRAA
jgi:hypothetical protein